MNWLIPFVAIAEPSGHGFFFVCLAFLRSSEHLTSSFGPAALKIAPHTGNYHANVYIGEKRENK